MNHFLDRELCVVPKRKGERDTSSNSRPGIDQIKRQGYKEERDENV